MKVDMAKLDPWAELAFQDLLVDVAAVVAATDADRTRNCDERNQNSAFRNSPLGRQTRLPAGII